MKIMDYNLNLHSNSTTTELKQNAGKTELSTSETSSQGHFASEQGAVFSASATTQSELKISDDQTLGVLQKSGVFLFESGEAGAISHIDIAKQTPVYV